jgi:hypothetical protein
MIRRTSTLLRVAVTVAAFLAVACTESIAPDHGGGRTLPGPAFSYAPGTGVTLHTDNGALGYSGRVIRKGFDRRDSTGAIIHPVQGDAVVATFYWFGSTNIVDSVRDIYTDAFFTPIGNTYHLVDYVTAGGISMATYVATNVHFDATRGYVFAIEADLSDTISDGGVKMTAWTGVEDVYPTAIGAFHSASVSASTPTPVVPGPLTIGGGSVAFGVSLSNGGVNIASRPSGWTNIGGGIGSDGRLQDDGDYYKSPGGESIDPQWTWDFQHASTALATVLELKPGAAPSGSLTVNTSTSGSSLDSNGYTVSVDSGAPQSVGTTGSVTFSNLAAGSHTVTLADIAANCAVSGPNPQTVSVTGGSTTTATFTLSCTATTGDLAVNASTSGSNLDPDGYTVTVDGGSGQAIGVNGSVTFANLAAGNHTVALSGVATNCTVSGANPQTVGVTAGTTTSTSFSVTCVIPPGNLTVSTSTTGGNLDPDGYTVSVDGGAGSAIGVNSSTTFTNLSAGNHTVQLSGVASNCAVNSGNPQTINVPSGGTAPATFAVSCNSPPVVDAGPDDKALTGLMYSSSQSFSDATPNGPWTYRIDWGDGSVSTGTRTGQGSFSVGHTYMIILPRTFTIRVTVTDAAGASGSDTKSVSVTLL